MEIDMEIDDDSECEYENEEYLVYVDIDPTSLAEEQIKDSRNLKIFGLDTKKPLLQINNQFFEGEFDLSMGTHVFFEKDDRPVDELYGKCERYYKFSAKTNKVLKMSRVLLKEKATDIKTNQEKDIPSIKEQLTIHRTYEQALNLFLATGRKQPRNIPSEFNCEHLLTTPIVTEDNKEASEENCQPETSAGLLTTDYD